VTLPIESFDVAGRAVVFTPRLTHPGINDVMKTLLEKLEKEFNKNKNDSKFLIYAPRS
jgi:hypothetical protein